MSAERVEITVTCPTGQGRAVATQITRDTGCTTRLRDAQGELITVRAPDGALATLETVRSPSVRSEPIPFGERLPDYRYWDAGSDVEDKLTRSSTVEHRDLQSQAGDRPVSGVDNRSGYPDSMFSKHAEALSRVVHHVCRLANRWVKFSRFHSSPSLITRSGVAGASSVGDGPACCGDPARPGHPKP